MAKIRYEQLVGVAPIQHQHDYSEIINAPDTEILELFPQQVLTKYSKNLVSNAGQILSGVHLCGTTPLTQVKKANQVVHLSPEINEQGDINWESNVSFTDDDKITMNVFGEKTIYFVYSGEKRQVSGEITINNYEEVHIYGDLIITEEGKLINNGIIRLFQGGQLINNSSNNIGGIIEVETVPMYVNSWRFAGAPFSGYKLESIIPLQDYVSEGDVGACIYDKAAGNWASDWSNINTQVDTAEGFLLAPSIPNYESTFYNVFFTSYGDGECSPIADKVFENTIYDYSIAPKYELNNSDITITHELIDNGGVYLAVCNPYPFKLDVKKFIIANESVLKNAYISKQRVLPNYEITWDPVSEGEIAVTEGFFIELKTAGQNTIIFTKDMIRNNINNL